MITALNDPHRGRIVFRTTCAILWLFGGALHFPGLLRAEMIPLTDLGTGLYLGQFQGGLYPGGSNQMPAAHASAGLARAHSVQPLNFNGDPDPAGRMVFMSIGMSNTTEEFCSANGDLPCDPWTFMGQAAVHPDVNHSTLAIVNGANGGQAAPTWDDPSDPNYNRIRSLLFQQGLSESQVQAVWVKVANGNPSTSLPDPSADANLLVSQMGDIARALAVRYPNLQQVFFSSRIYAGFATTTLNPEPFAYESGFAVKRLIEAQINQMAGGGIDPLAGDLDLGGGAPWIAWGPYLWADGTNPRSDGLVWLREDFASDGTHPSMSGEEKVGSLLLDFMLESPHTEPWFRTAVVPEPQASTLVLSALLVWGSWAAVKRRANGRSRHGEASSLGRGARARASR